MPDLVAVRGAEALVVDCKSGKQRDSDSFQVLTYMRVLPLTHAACRDLPLAGEVQYRDASVHIAPGQLTDELKGLIRGTIARVGSETPAVKVPTRPTPSGQSSIRRTSPATGIRWRARSTS